MRLLIAFLAVLLISSSPVYAEIKQTINIEYDPTPDDAFNNDDIQSIDTILGSTSADIDRALIAGININGVEAGGSVGEFGNYGVFGRTLLAGSLRAQVDIEADIAAPPFGTPSSAEANFIIDGGSFEFVAGPGTTLEFQLTLQSNFNIVFQSRIDITGDTTFVNPTAIFGGDDIGATQNPLNPTLFDIPLSFQTADLGILNPGEIIELDYQLFILVSGNDLELVSFEFQDPLSIGGSPIDPSLLRPQISAVPIPASFWLMFSSLTVIRLRLRHLRRVGCG